MAAEQGVTALDAMDPLQYFSPDYVQARERFRQSAESTGATLYQYPIDLDSSLTIDVAVIQQEPCAGQLVVSSGVHGVEGPLGSAMQLAALELIRQRGLPPGLGYVLIHSINPFGFAHHRRWNEDNVDLNRNFRCSSNTYTGCPPGYLTFQSILNPESPPSRIEPFRAKAFWNIARHGIPAIKEAVATGQYEYPKGLFFGGHDECCSARIVRKHFDQWMGSANRIVHLDVHTGLGRFGNYKLLLEYPRSSPQVKWFREVFDNGVVEDAESHPTSYDARGTFGLWSSAHMVDRDFYFATLEVGTHSIVRVLAALRAENRAHHYAPNDPHMNWAREELQECFCPASPRWRRKVITDGIEVMQRCAEQLIQHPNRRPTSAALRASAHSAFNS